MSEPWLPSTQKGMYANGVAWVAGVLVLVLVIGVIAWGLGWIFAPARGKLQARQQINSGSFRIAAYNHFFDDCASIQGLEGQLAALKAELTTATGDDKARVQANIAGITGLTAQAVAEYNADARKSYTIGQFRSAGLPFHIDLGERVTCS